MKKWISILMVAMLLLGLTGCSGWPYDTSKLDALFEAEAEEENTYWPGGGVSETKEKLLILEELEEDRQLRIALRRQENSRGKYDYDLMANLHDSNPVNGYIAEFSFTYYFYDDADMQRTAVYAQVNCFRGTESVENLHQQAFYSVGDLDLKDGKLISCTFTPIEMIGAQPDPGFKLPQEDAYYLQELVAEAFARATEYLKEKDVPLFY